ncbi:MAG TPA: pilus assembly protein N-terminal domain-containing protein [Vicinamibacterales bacterium]|nr:pilus assembly protein N-terminal domain-containing protein [Vicinamibacterales bacterium]
MTSRRRAARVAALVIYIIVVLVATPQAQQPVAFASGSGVIAAGPEATTTSATAVDLLVGRSTILNVGSAIARVSLTVPDVADAMVTAPSQLLIHGKTPGTISLFVWDRAGGIKTYEVSVRRDLTHLIAQLKELFPGEPLTVMGSGKDIVLSGTVSSKYVIDKAAEVAGGYVEKKEYVVNLLKQQEGVASNQVMLRVRFAEVSRSALQELGASFVANGFKNDWYGRTSTQQFPAPDFDSDRPGGLTFSDYLNVFLFNTKHGVGAVMKALQSKGLFQSLAEPNLIALNGKEASFLAGGEYPYPVVQSGGNSNAVTIMFKEFGVRLTFTPTVLGGDLINLKVRPEVSSLDFGNGVNISGFRVPALSTRRTDTEVELQDGQTFAIAGLMNNTVSSTMSKIPGIGDIPVLGYLFKSRAYQKQQTELVVMITPSIIRRGSAGVSQGLPTAVEPYLGAPSKRLPQPDAYIGSPRYPAAGQQPPRTGGDAAMAPQAPVPQYAAPKPASPAPMNAAPAANGAAVREASPAAAMPMQVETAPAPKVDPARLRDEQKKAAEAQRKAAEDRAAAEKKAAQQRERQKKLDDERAKREAAVAKKNQEEERKRQAELRKHEKTLAEAAARLKQAQEAYQAEAKKKGNQ